MQNLIITIDGDNYPILVLPERPNSLLDKVVAQIYQVKTEHVNQAVNRNPKKFPVEFYFELTDAEVKILKSQNVISNPKAFNRSKPKAFTWEGANMLATVLQSDIAVQRSV